MRLIIKDTSRGGINLGMIISSCTGQIAGDAQTSRRTVQEECVFAACLRAALGNHTGAHVICWKAGAMDELE